MAIKVQIPTPMREQAGGKTEVNVTGATVRRALDDLVKQYPALEPKLFENGKLRPYINIFVNDEDIRYLDEMDTKVTDGVDGGADPRGRGRAEPWPDERITSPRSARRGRGLPADPGRARRSPAACWRSLHAYVFLEGSDAERAQPGGRGGGDELPRHLPPAPQRATTSAACRKTWRRSPRSPRARSGPSSRSVSCKTS